MAVILPTGEFQNKNLNYLTDLDPLKTTNSKFIELKMVRFRWNGYINGLTLFYSHYTDTVEEEIHSIPITPGLTPIAFLQNIEKTYLGHPYTECVPTYSVNRNFENLDFRKGIQFTE